MLTLVTGGSESGKSGYAEMLAESSGAERLFYVATMKPEGDEAARRIEKHRKRRKDKGFVTLERSCDLKDLKIPGPYKGSLALIEDLGNLVANEQFDTGGNDDEITARVMDGIRSVCEKAEYVLVVCDDIFSDTGDYDKETLRYIELMGKITGMTAEAADSVCRVICGIALPVKRKRPGDAEHGKKG